MDLALTIIASGTFCGDAQMEFAGLGVFGQGELVIRLPGLPAGESSVLVCGNGLAIGEKFHRLNIQPVGTALIVEVQFQSLAIL